MGFGYELGVSSLIAEIAQELDLASGESQGFLASLMDDSYWGAPFHKMVKVIDFVQRRGPDYGHRLNMDKSIYLMSPPGDHSLSEAQLETYLRLLCTMYYSSKCSHSLLPLLCALRSK